MKFYFSPKPKFSASIRKLFVMQPTPPEIDPRDRDHADKKADPLDKFRSKAADDVIINFQTK